jgi:dTDP-4-amino-4,6-dideoxygalactose transaminase
LPFRPTARSLIGSASSVVLAGARPVFADVDPNTQTITAATDVAAASL